MAAGFGCRLRSPVNPSAFNEPAGVRLWKYLKPGSYDDFKVDKLSHYKPLCLLANHTSHQENMDFHLEEKKAKVDTSAVCKDTAYCYFVPQMQTHLIQQEGFSLTKLMG